MTLCVLVDAMVPVLSAGTQLVWLVSSSCWETSVKLHCLILMEANEMIPTVFDPLKMPLFSSEKHISNDRQEPSVVDKQPSNIIFVLFSLSLSVFLTVLQ